jgi:hypothetical protein
VPNQRREEGFSQKIKEPLANNRGEILHMQDKKMHVHTKIKKTKNTFSYYHD